MIFMLWHFVLIDTWWNVNTVIFSIYSRICNSVLIDTWWNVNSDQIYMSLINTAF